MHLFPRSQHIPKSIYPKIRCVPASFLKSHPDNLAALSPVSARRAPPLPTVISRLGPRQLRACWAVAIWQTRWVRSESAYASMIVEVGALFLREASNFGRGGSYTAPPSLGTQAWPWGRTWQICTWGLCGSGQPTWSAIGKFALGPTRARPTHVVDYPPSALGAYAGPANPRGRLSAKLAFGPTRARPTHVVDYLTSSLHPCKYPTRWAQGSSPG